MSLREILRRVPLSTGAAALAAAAMLVVAIGAGAALGVVTRPSPTPVPTPTPTPVPSPTEEPDTSPLVFKQPLSAGCATEGAVWVVSDGGGIGRFDGRRWRLIDTTLRSLVAAACEPDTVIAIGPVGRIVRIDDQRKTIQPDDLGPFDAYAISLTADGGLIAGSGGTVQRNTFAGWVPFARGIEEDLFGIVGFGGESAWAVGAGGVTYRLEPRGWVPYPSGTTKTLRTIAGSSPIDAVAAGDGGVLVRFDGRWRSLASGIESGLRASARVGAVTYVVGDRGVALRVEGDTVTPIDLGTTCTLRSVFARGGEVWFVGSEGTLAGVWRRTGDHVDKWGTC